MKKGRIKMSMQFLKDALQFPDDWEIESMSFNNVDQYISMVISGDDFPKTTSVEIAEIKDCHIAIHREKEGLKFEVKKI